MFDDELFGFVPDIDGDGDHDLLDFLILDSILEDEERELEAGRKSGIDDDDEDNVDNDDIFGSIDHVDDWDSGGLYGSDGGNDDDF